MADLCTDNVASENGSPPKKKKRTVLNETITLDNHQIPRSPTMLKKNHILQVRRSPRLCQRENSFADQNTSRIIGSIPENEKMDDESSFAKNKTSENDKPTPNSASKKENKRKSKRRSSFVSGRISKPFSAAQNDKICKDLPVNLSQDTRLEMLYKKSVEHSLNRLQEDFQDFPQLESFKVQDAAESQLTELRERGDFIKATTPSEKLLQSAENQRVEETITLAEEQIIKYDKEIAMWDKILEEHKNAADEAERHRLSVENTPEQLNVVPENMSKEQKLMLYSKLNSKELLKKLQEIHNKQVLTMDAINRHVKRHSNTFHQAKKLIEEQSSNIAAVSFPTLVGKSPRKLIQDVIHHNNKVTLKECDNVS